MNKLKEKWRALPPAAKASTAYLICNIVQKCLSFFTMPLFTNLLTEEQYGQVTVYGSWSGILSILLTLNLAYGSFSTAMVKFEEERDSYISSIQGICLMLCALFFAIYLPFRTFWNGLLELPTPFVVVLVMDIFFNTAILLWCGKKQFEYRYVGVVAITMLQVLMVIGLSYAMIVRTEEKGYARILGGAIPTVLVGGTLFVINLVRGKKLFSKVYWKYALGFNIPLLAYYFSQVIFNQSDRIMISHMVGTDKAALYGVACSLATVLSFVMNAINSSYIPWFYGKLRTGAQRENRRISMGISLVLAILLSGVIWFAPEIILIFSNRNYVEAANVVPPVAMSTFLLFYAQLFINVEFFHEQKGSLVGASMGAAVANLVLNWIYIPKFGYVAAAYTTLVSYILFAFCNCLAMKKLLRTKGIADDAYDYRNLVLLFLAFCVTSFLGSWLYPHLMVRIIISALVLVVVWIKRQYFIDIYHDFK